MDIMLVAIFYIVVTFIMLVVLLKKGRSKLMILYFIFELYFGAVAVVSYMD